MAVPIMANIINKNKFLELNFIYLRRSVVNINRIIPANKELQKAIPIGVPPKLTAIFPKENANPQTEPI